MARDGRTGSEAAVLPRAITHAKLVRDWGRTLDAFGEALESERRYFSPSELKRLQLHLAADRRWLQRFAVIRNFP